MTLVIDLYMVTSLVHVSFFFFNQKTAYEMRISDWSSDVCSSDLSGAAAHSFGNLAQRGFKLAQAGHFVSDLRHYAALTAVMSIPALNSREGTALVMSHTAPSKLIRS